MLNGLNLTQTYQKHHPCCLTNLQEIEKYFGSSALEGEDAGSGETSSAALKRENLRVEAVSTKAPQRPMDDAFALLIQDQVLVADFQLARVELVTRVIHVPNAENPRIRLFQALRFFGIDATHDLADRI